MNVRRKGEPNGNTPFLLFSCPYSFSTFILTICIPLLHSIFFCTIPLYLFRLFYRLDSLLSLSFAVMKCLSIFSGFCIILLSACGNNETASSSENDVDAARNFIRAALDGQYTEAQHLIVADSMNLQYLDAFATNYRERMNREDKRGYRESSINIHDIQSVNDSVTIVHYSNSYKQIPESLRVVRRNNNWLVDLKYSFTPADSTHK